MSVYDTDISRVLGKEACNYMLERVSHGYIRDQHMRDISSQLHPLGLLWQCLGYVRGGFGVSGDI